MCVSPDQSLPHCESLVCSSFSWGRDHIVIDNKTRVWHECTPVGFHVSHREQICGPTKVLRVLVHPGVQEATESVHYLCIFFIRAEEGITREDQTECHM